MQNAIKVGTRVMTIGRLVGVVVAVNTDNTLEVDIGTKGNPVIIVINREGIGLNLDAPQPIKGNKNAAPADNAHGDVDADASTEEKTETTDAKTEDPMDSDKPDDSI